nr:CDP-alcohol phosphatidyltransferase family protein [Halomarina oriensis]
MTDSTGLWWALLAGVVAVALLAYVRLLLDRNRPVDAGEGSALPPARYATFGLANALTTGRGLLLAVLAGLFAVPNPGWLPALLYGSVVLLDVLDGPVARARDRTSVLGTRLDTAVDAAGLLVAGGLGVALGTLPVWFLAVGAARYCYVAGLWWRRRRGLHVGTLPPSRVRRPLAALQMVVTAAALAPVVGPPVTTLVATVAMTPFVVGFSLDYRAVTSRDVKQSAAQRPV